MKNHIIKKGSYKFTGMFVAMAIATLLLLPQVPRTFAYFTSLIESDEIKFTYEPIQAQALVYQPNIDSSMVYLSFPEFDMRYLTLTTIELNQVGGMKLMASEITHTVDTYSLRSWSSQGNEIAVYLDQETVEIPLTTLYPDDTTFYMQISGEADYKGARILFTGQDVILLQYEPVTPPGYAPGVGVVELVTPPEEGTEDLTEDLTDEEQTEGIPGETLPEDTDLTAPASGDDPLTDLPAEEPSEEPAIPGDPSEEPSKGSSEEIPEMKEEPSQETEEIPKATEVPSEEETPSKDSGGEEPISHGGETQHD